MDTNFIDHIRVFCSSGAGGNGSAHLHRAKYIPKGGPDGGDGGRGGHIIVRADSRLWTLIYLKFSKHIRAEAGENGSKNTRTGKSGADVYVDVPVGTVVKDSETGKVLFELVKNGQQQILCTGGAGGLGNDNFKSPTNRTPKEFTYGEPGADYPFTTPAPQLGIVCYRGKQSFAMADIPGIIKGAHEGKGLGIRFLRHIERNSVLLFMISCEDNVGETYRTRHP